MNQGKVKFFDSREGKRFGFIKVEEGLYAGKEIFFHYNDGQGLKDGEEEPEFTGSPTAIIKGKSYRLRDPQVGDELVFYVDQGYRGDKATPWGYKESYDRSLKLIANRPPAPPPTIYRIFSSMGPWGESGKPGDPKDAKILWEGSDLKEALRRYPVPKGKQSPGSDPIIPYYSHDDGFEIRHWWERQNGEGTWEQCSDPRPLGGCNRQFERITYG